MGWRCRRRRSGRGSTGARSCARASSASSAWRRRAGSRRGRCGACGRRRGRAARARCACCRSAQHSAAACSPQRPQRRRPHRVRQAQTRASAQWSCSRVQRGAAASLHPHRVRSHPAVAVQAEEQAQVVPHPSKLLASVVYFLLHLSHSMHLFPLLHHQNLHPHQFSSSSVTKEATS